MRIRDGIASRLQRVLRVRTVSRHGAPPDADALRELRALLAELYPDAFGTLEVETVAEHTVLARWPGADTEGPTLLMAHQDVVPADDEHGWSRPPFAADSDGETIVGRGAIDDKGSLVAILEAIDALVADGFVPARDVWLLLGHDEEVGGTGADAAIDELAARGVRPSLTLDEGGAVIEAPVPGVDARIAVIGVSEKGSAVVRMRVEQQGGHSSTPARSPATAVLARAVLRVTRARFPQRLTPTTVAMLETLAPHASGPIAAALRRARRLAPALRAVLGRNDETRAMLATTASVTMLAAGEAPNATAERADALVSARIGQGSSIAETLAVLRGAVRDARVRLEVVQGWEPSPVSPAHGEPWDAVVRAIEAEMPGVVPVAYDMLGATDGRYAHRICEHVYRFTPFHMSSDDRARLHARDERIAIAELERGARWYCRLLESR